MSSSFLAEFDEVLSGVQAGPANRWVFANFFSVVVAAQGSISPVYWPGGGLAKPIPGLPTNERWYGGDELAGHLLLWRDEVIKHSDVNDFSTWIPVSQTSVSLSVETLSDFTQPISGSETDWIFLSTDSAAFVEGMYVRIDLNSNDPENASFN